MQCAVPETECLACHAACCEQHIECPWGSAIWRMHKDVRPCVTLIQSGGLGMLGPQATVADCEVCVGVASMVNQSYW
jgi:hypothetical protein